MKRVKVVNITGMSLILDGTRLLPGESKEVELSKELEGRIANGFFKIISESKEIKEPVEPVEEKVIEEEQDKKEAAIMVEKRKIKPSFKKTNKNN